MADRLFPAPGDLEYFDWIVDELPAEKKQALVDFTLGHLVELLIHRLVPWAKVLRKQWDQKLTVVTTGCDE